MKNFLLVFLCMVTSASGAVRLKDLATIKGVRSNILIGYGIIVGLQGTGDSDAEVTAQSLTRLFKKLGLQLGDQTEIKSKNAAAVIVTAKLPPFARVGNKIDVTVSSIGDSKSLEGGVLLVTPLRAGDQNIYAVAQGKVSLGTLSVGKNQNFPTVGRVVEGATIEKDIDTQFEQKKSFRLSLKDPDFTTAARVATSINAELGGNYAEAKDSGSIDLIVPFNYEGKNVELMAILENVRVNIDQKAKVVLNERTGTIVIGKDVAISGVSISHGDLTIKISSDDGKGKKEEKEEGMLEIKDTTNVSDLVKALNTLGVRPKDLTAIFQALRKEGALHAELEIL